MLTPLRFFGGLFLLLLGVRTLRGGLDGLAQGRLKSALQRLAGSPLRGLLLGTAAAALLQSSTAITVMTVGLVGGGALSLRAAAGVIMGANIGTTVTAQLLRLNTGDSPTQLFLVICLAASAGLLLCRRAALCRTGRILLGMGMLFSGMNAMEQAVTPLQNAPALLALFSHLEHPLWGLLLGAALTALLQSSSVAVGLLQASAACGGLSCRGALAVVLGLNIGTCATALLSALGQRKEALRAAMLHLVFNVLGSVLCLPLLWDDLVPLWRVPATKALIANFHTAFNLGSALLMLPFTGLLVRLVCRLVPDGRKAESPPGDA